MKRLTIFSFGYHGWGSSTQQLLKSVDAVEAARGFRSPIFVDIRIRRQGRAPGFIGTAFEDLLGPKRHRWMRDLGNESIVSNTGRRVQIRRPAAAAELLDLAIEAADANRRLVFFCNCQWPKWAGQTNCHRLTVVNLLLGTARRQQVPLTVVEWPGGKPRGIDLQVPAEVFGSVRKGRVTIPLSHPRPLADYAGLPWGSIATVRSDGESIQRVVGPAKWERDQWVLPVLSPVAGPQLSLDRYKTAGESFRRSRGLVERPA